jgi:phage/plasmid-associated DNA primase
MNSNSKDKPSASKTGLIRVTEANPCFHCGKPDWCYLIGDLSVCNRDEPPATGWEVTTKSDADGHFFYAPVRPKKPIRPAQTRYWEYPSRDGEKLVRVRRIDFGNGKKKDIKQQHWDETLNDWETNLKGISRASIPVYRYADIQKVIADDQLIFIVDGEQCADYLWDLGLAATTSIGGMGKWRITDTSDLQRAKVVICPDRDNPGLKDATKVSEHFPEAQWLYSDPDSWEWDSPPDSDGLDVMDWIKDKGLNAQDILNSLTSRPRTQENVVSLSFPGSGSDYIPDTAPSGEQSFIHKAIDALYSGRRWASVAGQLLEYTGTHYEVRSEGSEKKRIYAWLKTYTEFVKGKYRCNRYNSASVNDVYNCIVGSVDVDIKDINPLGLNCSNGVLRINPDGSHTLHPHNPDHIYTYVGGKYDPDIDPRDCDRLLECLESAQREIFLRTVAASLCLPLVRLKMSRVKGLLCHGDGSNGKDALRTALVAVLGRGVTGKTLKDFQIYDTGRKFPLAGLEGSLCNWSSENSDSTKLEKLQSLKQFITGDELTIEHKGKGEYPYKPEAIFLANCNLLPSISSDAEAIKSRYSILSFKKTYAVGADTSKGQLEADPRFKEDPSFVLEKIAPALLNRMLERLPSLLTEGIDYNSTNAALRAAQEKSNHLWQFMRDRGYEAGKGERVYAKDAWSDLQDWYIETGTLELEYDRDGKEKRVWNELPGRDTPVKAINQLFARFSELVPNLEKYRHTERGFESERTRGDFYYIGLIRRESEKSDKSAPPSPPVDTASILPPPVLHQKVSGGALVEQTILTQSGGGDGGALSSPFAELCNLLSQLTGEERQKMVDLLTGVPCSDPLKAFKVGDKVAGNKERDSSYHWHGSIVEIHTSISCKVNWQEREGMRGGRVISMLFCDLRKI